MKFISPGGWFSLEYPANWSEFEDSEETFLFYNPNQWNGNFRISAYKGETKDYASQCVAYELKNNPTSSPVQIDDWACAYSAETFQEDGAWYTTHIWVTGKSNICFECSFTVAKGSSRNEAEDILRTLKVRTGKEGQEIIPIRLLEIGEVNAAFDWASTTVKKNLTKDFTSQEADIEKLQKLIDGGKIQVNQRVAWESIGLAFGTILENEMEGMTWVSVINGPHEYAALQFGDLLVNPVNWVWSKAKAKQPIELKAEFIRIKEEVEKRL